MSIKDKLNQTRNQRRFQDQVRQDIDRVFNQLTSEFLEAFISKKHTETEIIELMDNINARWRTWCKAKHIISALHDSVDRWMVNLVEDFKKEKKESSAETLQDISKNLK